MTLTFFTPDFGINTLTTGNQYNQSVAALSDGRFIVVWMTYDGTVDGSGTSIRGQIFLADGSRSGVEFQVNTTTTNDQSLPTVTALANGGFFVAWGDYSASPDDTSEDALRGQFFDANGTMIGPERLIPQFTDGYQSFSQATRLANGNIAVVWEHDGIGEMPEDPEAGIRVRIIRPDGTFASADLGVNTATFDNQYDPRITALADGGFFIVWRDFSATAPDTNGQAVRGQRFDADGTRVGPEQVINQVIVGAQSHPDVGELADGRMIVVFQDGSGTGGDTSPAAIKGRFLGADGTPTGNEILINTTTEGSQVFPRVIPLLDGGFFVAWVDFSNAGTDLTPGLITGQRFDANGAKVGPETRLNTLTDGFQSGIELALLADGRIVVTWDTSAPTPDDPDGYSMRARIIDPRTSAVDLTGTDLADDWYGTLFNDTMAGGAGNDTLRGEGGNDLLDGGSGADSLLGGAGDDTFVVDSTGDQVIEAVGAGTDTVRSSASHTLGAHVENLVLTGSADLNGTGNALGNRLGGNAGENRLAGGTGNDTLLGRAGDDRLIGGTGKDLVRAGRGDDRVSGNGGRDVLNGEAGRDRIAGGGGNDLLSGGAQNDTLLGGSGNDRMFGGTGRDRLLGLDGRDRLEGDGDNDVLIGGRGADTMSGGAGADVFLFRSAAEVGRIAGRDVITDFRSGIDRIDLSRVMPDGTFIGNAAFSGSAGELRYGASDATLYGDIDGDGNDDFQIRLSGAPSITSNDFIF
ncbi:calcium-binding protein [Aliigemmobacter aestuarii]|uniref:Calcium-binding protein n=1 Tax=Aliigemmobacter aestuarii TaxID=1445661 RepID=A0A4S3ML14_9RHOB|nr:M10 family metallopeptidase C-terminal domain-containing protein [Gemmobacter aestuarii]THD82250.1 calcium-binding protein [Gemmobacter aestuarii]